jgi:hypothetical protein
MSLQSISQALATIKDRLSEEFPVAHAEVVGGPFDADEVRRHVAHNPAILITSLLMDDFTLRGNNGFKTRCSFAVYILTQDNNLQNRHVYAGDLTSRFMRICSKTTWGEPDSFTPPIRNSIKARNLYSGYIDSIAVALWAVFWQQEVFFDDAS